MNLYAVMWSTPAGRKSMKWAGTQAEAASIKASLKRESIKARVEPAEVPTSKPELLAWLNNHADTWEYE